MECQDIVDGNKLIADFMRLPTRSLTYHDPCKKKLTITGFDYSDMDYDFIEKIPYVYFGFQGVKESGYHKIKTFFELRYNCSWDWLMPVIRTIKYGNPFTNEAFIIKNEISHESMLRYKAINNELQNLNIEGCWFCVVQFIKWHNNKRITSCSHTSQQP